MSAVKDVLSAEKITENLSVDLKNIIKPVVLEKTTSTNDIAKKYAVEGASEGAFVVSGTQTDGRGRMGRNFFSPEDTGVYMSLLLRPEVEPSNAVSITTAAAVAVCEALEKISDVKAEIKWVNDVFVNGKKVCGILTEAGFSADKNILDYAVLGVGVNMYAPENGFPEEIKETAGAVFSEKHENARNEFVSCFLNSFMNYYNNICENTHGTAYAERCFVLGKSIDVIRGGETRRAKALALDENCGLSVRFEDGTEAVLNSGEISVRTV